MQLVGLLLYIKLLQVVPQLSHLLSAARMHAADAEFAVVRVGPMNIVAPYLSRQPLVAGLRLRDVPESSCAFLELACCVGHY